MPRPALPRYLLLTVMALAFARPGFAQSLEYAYRFDADTPVADAASFGPWSRLLARHAVDQDLLDACLASYAACPYYLRGMRLILQRAVRHPPHGQLQLVNRFVNARRWEEENDDTGEEWRPLVSFLRDGGDCEDFAIAKYFMLRALDFPAHDLRIVGAYERSVPDQHAVLAARVDGAVLFLETDDTIRPAREHRDYRFLYAINEHSLWNHAPDGALALRPYHHR